MKKRKNMSKKETTEQFNLREKMLAYLRLANKVSPDILETATKHINFANVGLEIPEDIFTRLSKFDFVLSVTKRYN